MLLLSQNPRGSPTSLVVKHWTRKKIFKKKICVVFKYTVFSPVLLAHFFFFPREGNTFIKGYYIVQRTSSWGTVSSREPPCKRVPVSHCHTAHQSPSTAILGLRHWNSQRTVMEESVLIYGPRLYCLWKLGGLFANLSSLIWMESSPCFLHSPQSWNLNKSVW